MKKAILFLAAILTFSTFANAQKTTAAYSVFGQLLNLSNTHKKAVKDSSTGTLNLTGALWSATTGLPSADPFYGTGTITMNASILHASTTSTVNPAVQFIPQGSFDNSTWVTMPGITVLTLTATSATIPVTGTYTISATLYPYIRGKFIVASDTASVQAWVWQNKAFTYGN
jgi:hypothetical protein